MCWIVKARFSLTSANGSRKCVVCPVGKDVGLGRVSIDEVSPRLDVDDIVEDRVKELVEDSVGDSVEDRLND